MSSNTPGPWHWEKHNGLMYLMTSDDCDVLGTGIDIADNDIDLPVIAAAADMLAALEAISHDAAAEDLAYETRCALNDAIRKSKGDADDGK